MSFWNHKDTWVTDSIDGFPRINGRKIDVQLRVVYGAAIVKVAVIGAGAAGLVAASELLKARHDVSVFEQSSRVGGIWVYQAASELDPLGQTGPRLHASMYASLRTNLPRDLMAFFDFSFDSSGGGVDDWPRYPGHAQVLRYLEEFADAFSLRQRIRFNTKVVQVVQEDRWLLTLDGDNGSVTEVFDALAVCNGHYTEPRLPDIPGSDNFPVHSVHSHNYRSPDEFLDKQVVIVGSASSGADLTEEIACTADRVYWCSNDKAASSKRIKHLNNVTSCGQIKRLIELEDQPLVGPVDSFVYATGYHYRFPFLSDDLIDVRDNWVTPLYQDLLCITQPTLALIGLPFKIIPFPIFQIQARWFARMLNADFELPTVSSMRQAMETRVERLRSVGVLQRNYHALDDEQYDYYDCLAQECGDSPLPQWYRELGQAARRHVEHWPDSFRDRLLDAHGAPTRYPKS